MWAKTGTVIGVLAALIAIIMGFVSFGNNYISKEVFDAKVEKVEIQLAGALQDFRDDFKQERIQRKEGDLNLNSEQLQLQEEVYQDRLRKLEQSSDKDNWEEQYYKRQLSRTRKRGEKIQDVLIELQKDK